VYETYRDCSGEGARDILRKYGLQYDVTVIPPLLLGEEYVKTLGHYHLPLGEASSHPEIFEVLEGEAAFLVQKQCVGETADVSLLIAKEGEKVLVPPGRGHVVINASSRRLVVGCLISRDCVRTYDPYVERRGAAFYLLTRGRLVRNPNYSSAPEVRALRVEHPPFLESGSGLVQTFLKDPSRLALLNEPSRCAEWGVLESAGMGVVLSGGQGSGLRPVTFYLPKGMVPIGRGQGPLLEYTLGLLTGRNVLIFLNVFFAVYAALMFLTLLSMIVYS
jgi:glucose-6-phosphate isomerase